MTDQTVTLRLWRGKQNRYESPDETHELPVQAADIHRYEAETLTLEEYISARGWMGFDLTDLPESCDLVTLYVHADDSYHEPEPLDQRAVERGLVFDHSEPGPGVDPFVCRLDGIVEVYATEGGR